MEMRLTKDEKAVAHAVDKDDSRPSLQCVRIGKGAIVATDGYVLVGRPLPQAKDMDYIFADGKKLLQEKGEIVQLEPVIVTGAYPAAEQLFPTGPVKAEIKLSVKRLKKFLKALGSEENITIRVFEEASAPVHIKGEEVEGLIMQNYP